jgi:hypothetical protein
MSQSFVVVVGMAAVIGAMSIVLGCILLSKFWRRRELVKLEDPEKIPQVANLTGIKMSDRLGEGIHKIYLVSSWDIYVIIGYFASVYLAEWRNIKVAMKKLVSSNEEQFLHEVSLQRQ